MSDDKNTYKYAIEVQYVGKNYSGSQIQRTKDKKPEFKTVQSELEKAISTLIKGGEDENSSPPTERKIKTIFSGRTDKGVNAKGQIVHFETEKPIVASQFIHSMNGLLPNDISVSDLKEVDSRFHAQKSSKRRHYRYVFYNRKTRSAFDGDLMLVKWDLNFERMQKSLDYLIGEHDFSSFKGSASKNPNKVCFIYKAECKKLGDTVQIDIEGNRFLYNMVRTIVGTLLMLERQNLDSIKMKEILDAKDRTLAGKTVNPHGLTLMKVEY